MSPLPFLVYGALLLALPSRGDGTAPAVLVAFGLILVGLLVPVITWARYRLDEEGIEVRTVDKRRRYAWGELRGVRGTSLEGDRTRGNSTIPLTRYAVYDRAGRRLFRISPWTRNRRRLAAEIRRRVQATRRPASR